MLKSLINTYIKAALEELFIDSNKDSFQFSVGADLFSDSNIKLTNLTFRPDIFDAYLYPIKLSFGHVDDINITGIAELALAGGKVKISVDNIFLLFRIEKEEDINPEYLQYLKKIIIELTSLGTQHVLMRELLKKIQCISGIKDPDFKKQRLLILKLSDYLFKNFYVSIKNIHIRIETPNGIGASSSSPLSGYSNPLYCNALGMTMPFIQISPKTQLRPQGVNKDDPLLSLTVNNLQIYCDYQCQTYLANGDSPLNILRQFQTRWKSEVHTGLLLPFDLEIIFAVQIKKRSGLVSPKIYVDIPKLKIVSDYRQLEIIQGLIEQYVIVKKRCSHLVNLRATFGKDGPPKLVIIGGNHILPILSTGYFRFPAQSSVVSTPVVTSVASSTSSLPAVELPSNNKVIMLLKARVGSRWKKALWKHIIRVIVHDVRLAQPYGRWLNLIRLCYMRKEYAFIYSRLLKRSNKSGNFVYNVNVRVDISTYKKLFDYEMLLSVETIMQFRNLANMICIVELFNTKRSQMRGASGRGGMMRNTTNTGSLQPYERIGMTWRDILLIHMELCEAERESAFKPRNNGSGSNNDNDNDETDDDTMSVNSGAASRKSGNDDTASVFSFRSRGGGGGLTDSVLAVPAAAASGAANMLNSTAKYLPRSLLQVGGSNGTIINSGTPMRGNMNRQSSSVNDTGNMNNSNHTNNYKNGQTDDLDAKLFGRKEMSAFIEFIGTFENEEKRVEGGQGEVIGGSKGTKIEYRIYDWNLSGESPKYYAIVDAIQYILLRHQKPLTVIPPDMTLNIETTDIQFRKPLENGVRQTLLALNALKFNMNLTITDSHSQTPTAVIISPVSPDPKSTRIPGSSNTGADQTPMLLVKSLHGFASIIGSLVQVRVTLQSLAIQLFVHNKDILDVLSIGNGVITLETLKSGSAGQSIRVDAITGKVSALDGMIEDSNYSYNQNNSQENQEVDYDEETGKFIGPGYTSPRGASTTAGTSHTQPGMKPPAPPASSYSSSEKNPGPRSVGAVPMPGTPAYDLYMKKKAEKEPFVINLLISSEHPLITTSNSSNTNGNKTYSELLNKSSSRQTPSNFLTLCLLLDFDDNINNAGGAADLQIFLGSMVTECSPEMITYALDDITQSNFNQIFKTLSQLNHNLFLHQDNAWYIDRTMNMPYVESLLDFLYDHTEPNDVDDDMNDEYENNSYDRSVCLSNSPNRSTHSNIKPNATITDNVPAPTVTVNPSTVSTVEAERTALISSTYSTGLEYACSEDESNSPIYGMNSIEINGEQDRLSMTEHSINNNNNNTEKIYSKEGNDKSDNYYNQNINSKNNLFIKSKQHIIPDFLQLNETKGNSSESSTSNEQQQQQQMILLRRYIRREYINYEYFKYLFKVWIPSDCSLCLRTSSFTIDLLSSEALEKMILTETEKLITTHANKSSIISRGKKIKAFEKLNKQVHKFNSATTGLNIAKHTYLSILIDLLHNYKQSSNHRMGNTQFQSLVANNGASLGANISSITRNAESIINDRKIHLEMPGMELVLIKKIKPIEDLFMKLFGIEIKIPLNESLLYELLALTLQRNNPHFK